MQDMFDALIHAFKSLLTPRMLVLTLWPMLLSLLFWGGLAWWFWDQWQADIYQLTVAYGVEDHLASWGFVWLAHWLVVALLVSLLLPAIYVTSLVFAAIFAMPLIVRFVAERDYPDLQMKHGGSFIGGVWNGLAAAFAYLVFWVITLPLWLIPFGAIVVPTLLSAWLNRRLFAYDALAEHASREEYDAIYAKAGPRLFGLGALLGFVHYVPILNFFTPIYIGLAYTHFCFARLQHARAAA